jgi:DNA-binding response OmpR family regulator
MKILVIEDSRATSDFIKRGLEEEGFAVDTAFTGEEGLELAQTFDYDLVLLDVMLPGKNGFEVCESLRQYKAHIPILMLTGKIEVEDRVHGLNSGADDYLVKPFSFGELVARIHALTRRARQPVHTELKAGPLVMNTFSRKVTFNGQNIELTNKEYALLEFLLLHPEMLVTRVMLEQTIWNQEFDGASNMIDVYIRRLRNKMGQDGEGLIQTVRGAGYRLVLP